MKSVWFDNARYKVVDMPEERISEFKQNLEKAKGFLDEANRLVDCKAIPSLNSSTKQRLLTLGIGINDLLLEMRPLQNLELIDDDLLYYRALYFKNRDEQIMIYFRAGYDSDLVTEDSFLMVISDEKLIGNYPIQQIVSVEKISKEVYEWERNVEE